MGQPNRVNQELEGNMVNLLESKIVAQAPIGGLQPSLYSVIILAHPLRYRDWRGEILEGAPEHSLSAVLAVTLRQGPGCDRVRKAGDWRYSDSGHLH